MRGDHPYRRPAIKRPTADVVGAILRAHPDLREVDVNPLLVFAEGEGVLALDALFITE